MAAEIGVADLSEVKGNGSASKTDCLSDDAMDLVHARYGLCPVEPGTETVFPFQDDVKPCPFMRIEMMGSHSWLKPCG